MALLLSLLTALVLLSSGPARTLGCDPLEDHVLLSRENVELLRDMNSISPLFCLKDRQHFRFPRAVVDGSQVQKAQALSVLHQMLQQISDLLATENSSVPWNTTLVDLLRTGLHRQLEDLDTCWAREMGEEGPALATQGPTLALKRYFQGIRLYLKEKQYSDCAWEVVRVEILRSFSSTIAALQERLRNEDGDVGSP
ncbi:interferon omega-2-like [Pipistrellus kuhlii]|uniref:interferon omega-2-like n=1 Tax=Pipistrellus kuhlii TaxID=59472 RepID=UPI00174EF2A5|nr:interferon omega-2-like [Pipistrellus kuhlii]